MLKSKFSRTSFSTTFATNLHKRRGNMDAGDWQAIGTIGTVAILAILVMGLAGLGPLASVVGQKSGGAGNVTACSSIPTGTAQQLKISDSAQQGASALTSPSANLFTSNGQGFSTDNPGSLSSAVTSGNAYQLNGGVIAQVTATGAFPVWATLSGSAVTMGGAQVLGVATSIPGSTAGVCVWNVPFTQIAAPASGTSATTNVIALVSSSTGAALQTASTVMPTASTLWSNSLNIKSTYTGAGYPISVPSTSTNTVVNYATGQTVPLGQFQTYGMIETISLNQTDYVVNLDPSAAPGLVMQQITNPAQTAKTLNYIISGFTGCAPTGGSVSSFACLSAPIDIYQTDSSISKHVDIVFQWIDMQQPAYCISHFTNPAVTSYPAASAGSAGIASSFAGCTVPTAAPDSGAPTILIEQYYSTIQKQA